MLADYSTLIRRRLKLGAKRRTSVIPEETGFPSVPEWRVGFPCTPSFQRRSESTDCWSDAGFLQRVGAGGYQSPVPSSIRMQR